MTARVTIIDCIFYDGAELTDSFEDLKDIQILISGQIFKNKVTMTLPRMKHLTANRVGVVKLVVCNCCGKLFVEGYVNHDDFDIVEDIMDI